MQLHPNLYNIGGNVGIGMTRVPLSVTILKQRTAVSPKRLGPFAGAELPGVRLK